MKKNMFIKISLTALVVFSCMIGCETTQQDGRLIKGLDLFARDEYDSSIAVFSKIIKEKPETFDALYYRALAYFKVFETLKGFLGCENVYNLDND